MSLLKTIKKLVFLTPSRCGRIYYEVNIIKNLDKISVKFTPTDEYLMLDPRRENEAFMPNHIHAFEKWQHIGLAIGSLRYFLDQNDISYTYDRTTEDVEIVLVDESKYDELLGELPGEWKHEKFKHTQRTFNSDLPVDAETVSVLNDMIEKFLSTREGYNIQVTDPKIRKKLASLAVVWDSAGGVNGYVRPAQMTTTPMMICVPPKEFDLQYWFDMGQLYSQLGLVAISRGYQIGFSNCCNVLDPRTSQLEDVLHVKFGTYTKENFVPRPWICIGKALDPSKPYNWIGVDNPYTDDLMISCILMTKEFVKVEENV